MLLDLIVSVVAMFVSPDAVRGLIATAPQNLLSEETARQHLAAAVAAAALTRTKPETLLSIAWHESRYKYTETTSEPPCAPGMSTCTKDEQRRRAPRWSCGVITPEPITDRKVCEEIASNLATGYLAGAQHLRAWLDVCRDHAGCALLGYAGAATHDCANEMTRACVAARDFATRSMWIARAIRPVKKSHRTKPLAS